jgi:cyclopropane fatty-acyl-phospholipid synthase-like methyltransferase
LQPEKGSILDIGAGTGDFLSVVKKNGWHIIGVEPSEKQKRLQKKGVSFVEETS